MGLRIGMVGVGLMGHGIAANVLRHGHTLVLLDHPGNQPVDDLLQAGAQCVATLAQVASEAEVLLLCVTGSDQVEAVLCGAAASPAAQGLGTPEAGLLAAMQPGTLLIDCSTALPARTRAMAQRVAQAGGAFVDAAMTRTPKEAAEGRLNLLVGGDAADVARAMPVLRCFAEHITPTGGVGSGHAMKLLHNYVSLGQIALIAEAAACANRAGVDANVFTDVLRQGGAGGVALERISPCLTGGDASNLRFSMANASKDLGYYQSLAHGLQAWDAIAQGVARTYAHAVQQGGGERAVPELAQVLSQAGFP